MRWSPVSDYGTDASAQTVAHQVPAVAVEIQENVDGPVLLDPRLLSEPDAPATHLVVLPPEIVGLEEQKHPPTCLIAHSKCRAATSRAHRHPPFAARKWGVLDREPQDLGEEVVHLVVVTDDQGDSGNQVRYDSLLYFQLNIAASLPRPFHLDPLDLHLERPSLFVTQHEAQGIDLFWLN